MRSSKWIPENGHSFPTYVIDFDERPECPVCKTLTNVHSYSPPSKKVGLHGTYYVRYKIYKCCNSACSNYKSRNIYAPNTRSAPHHHFDFEVEAKICELRFKGLRSLEEIESYLFFTHDIKLSQTTVGKIIKHYEVASKYENETIVLEEIKKNGGTVICVDALHPYTGAGLLLVAQDFHTERCIYVMKVKTQKFEVQKEFHEKLKNIMAKNEIPVLGIMSDDHKAQRNAIKEVWGEDVPHCACLFHFYKQILEKPLELHSNLIKSIRKDLRDITWVEYFRRGEFHVEKNTPISLCLEQLIKDLFTLTKWTAGRNNFRLDATKYFERIAFFHDKLALIAQDIKENHLPMNMQEERILPKLLVRLKTVLDEGRAKCDVLISVLRSLQEIKEILDTHAEAAETSLEELMKVVEVLNTRQRTEKDMGKHERHFIKEIVDFVTTRGQTLFNYRRVNENYEKVNGSIQRTIQETSSKEEEKVLQREIHVPRTNNTLESMFKALRYNLKRTLGQRNANRYLLAHGEYLFHVEVMASFNRIKEILMNADHGAISKQIRSAKLPKLTRLGRIKDDRDFHAIRREYDKMHARILASGISIQKA